MLGFYDRKPYINELTSVCHREAYEICTYMIGDEGGALKRCTGLVRKYLNETVEREWRTIRGSNLVHIYIDIFGSVQSYKVIYTVAVWTAHGIGFQEEL